MKLPCNAIGHYVILSNTWGTRRVHLFQIFSSLRRRTLFEGYTLVQMSRDWETGAWQIVFAKHVGTYPT
jgi:hypothetical protein